MSAIDVIETARVAGIRINVDGDDLVLEAASEPPSAVLALIKTNKADILNRLRPANDAWSAQDWQSFRDERAWEACIIEYLNRNPAPSDPGSCAHCRQPEQTGAAVVPFGVQKNTHIWLHPECWPAWHRERRRTAAEYLIGIGVWDHD